MDNYGTQNGIQNGEQLEKPMSLGDWIITMIVLAIPCVGLVMMFVWGFGEGNTSRKNYCRAALIFTVIGIVLTVIFYASIAAIVGTAFRAYSF